MQSVCINFVNKFWRSLMSLHILHVYDDTGSVRQHVYRLGVYFPGLHAWKHNS